MQSELSFFFHTFQQELGSGQWNINIPYKKTVLQVIKTNNFSNIFQWDYIRCNMWNRIEENNVCIDTLVSQGPAWTWKPAAFNDTQ